jgi:hypothetical protein
MAAFTNLALSASHLGTKYLNKIFAIHRGQYDELGMLMITAALIGLTIPVAAVVLFNPATGLTWKTIKGRFRVSGVRCQVSGVKKQDRV